MPPPVKTHFLILRKTAYSETSLIVAGLSPDYGQLHFMVRGGRRIGRKQSPIADLFRVLDIVFRPKPNGGLLTWSNADLHADFTALATDYNAYNTACRIAKFALANCPENDPQPRFYQAVTNALTQLCEPRKLTDGEHRKILIDTAVAYLGENGLLPDDEQTQSLEQVERILRNAECTPIS